MSATIDLTRAIGPNARPWRDAETKDIDMANRPVTRSLSTTAPAAQGWTFTGRVASDVRPVRPATLHAADEDEDEDDDVDDDDDIDDDDDDLEDEELEEGDEADGDEESDDDETDDDDVDDDFDDDDDDEEKEEDDDLTAQKHTPTRVH